MLHNPQKERMQIAVENLKIHYLLMNDTNLLCELYGLMTGYNVGLAPNESRPSIKSIILSFTSALEERFFDVILMCAKNGLSGDPDGLVQRCKYWLCDFESLQDFWKEEKKVKKPYPKLYEAYCENGQQDEFINFVKRHRLLKKYVICLALKKQGRLHFTNSQDVSENEFKDMAYDYWYDCHCFYQTSYSKYLMAQDNIINFDSKRRERGF